MTILGRTPNIFQQCGTEAQISSTIQNGLIHLMYPVAGGSTYIHQAKGKSAQALPVSQFPMNTTTAPAPGAFNTLNGQSLGASGIFDGATTFVGNTNGQLPNDVSLIADYNEVSVLVVARPNDTTVPSKVIFGVGSLLIGFDACNIGQDSSSNPDFFVHGSLTGSQHTDTAQTAQWVSGIPAVLIGRHSANLNVHELYINGVPNGGNTTATAMGAPSSDARIAIGAYPNGSNACNNFFDGAIFLVAVWDRPLTTWEIAQLSMNPFAVFGAQPSQALLSSMAALDGLPWDLAHSPQHQAQMAS